MPSCGGGEPGEDSNFAIYKCPSFLQVTTCDGRTSLNTILSGVLGTMTISNGLCVPSSGKEVDCNNDIGITGCDVRPTASSLTKIPSSEPGLLTINIDGDKGQCGGYSIGAAYSAVAGRP
jgi:hypothetical protein